MDTIFQAKKNFVVEYEINSSTFCLLVRARNEKDARNKCVGRVEEKVGGIYPYPSHGIRRVDRIYKKVQM